MNTSVAIALSEYHQALRNLAVAAAKLKTVRRFHGENKKVYISAQIAAAVDMTAAAYGIPPEEIVGRRRYSELVQPRWVSMYLAHIVFGLNTHAIARNFANVGGTGMREHSSISYAFAKLEKRMQECEELAQRVASIRLMLEVGLGLQKAA